MRSCCAGSANRDAERLSLRDLGLADRGAGSGVMRRGRRRRRSVPTTGRQDKEGGLADALDVSCVWPD